MRRVRQTVLAVMLALAVANALPAARLEVHPTNPRWLTTDGGESALVLTGAHTWSVFQDYEGESAFAANRYLGDLKRLGHNFTRGWFWEDGYYSPLPYVLEDGEYRLSPPYNQVYLKRLRTRIRAANKRGLFVSVMLFQGWSMDNRDRLRDPGPWARNPYNPENHSERVSKQRDALHIGLAQEQQLEYVSVVARKLCKEPNIIWEIANEAHRESLGTGRASNWQLNILERLGPSCRRRLTWVSCPLQIGLLPADKDVLNEVMYDMNTDIVTPCNSGVDFIENPKIADGSRVVVADSDHFIPDEVSPEWVWKAFLRGQHPIFMDLTASLSWWRGSSWDPSDRRWSQIRRALGAIQELVEVVEAQRPGSPTSGLAQMAPQARAGGRSGQKNRPASSEWALFSSDLPCPPRQGGGCRKARANGDEMLAYAGPGERTRICRLEAGSPYRYRWKKAVRAGFIGSARSRKANSVGCLELENPSSTFSIVYLERQSG